MVVVAFSSQMINEASSSPSLVPRRSGGGGGGAARGGRHEALPLKCLGTRLVVPLTPPSLHTN